MIVAIVVPGLLLLIAAVVAIVLLSLRQAAHAGGLNALCATYAASERPMGEVRDRQRFMVGALRYRNCVYTEVSSRGLYVDLRYGGGPVLVPWGAFGAAWPVVVCWRRMVGLSVGHPEVATISVELPLYELMRPYLAAEAQLPR